MCIHSVSQPYPSFHVGTLFSGNRLVTCYLGLFTSCSSRDGVLQVGMSVVVTLCIPCGPCNYWWGRYRAFLSAPRGTIRAECVSPFMHPLNHYLAFNFNFVSLVTLMCLSLFKSTMPRFHVGTLPCINS